MPNGNLILDRVTHVSLVDDPAVGESEWVVMKHADAEPPSDAIIKDGRRLSNQNLETLAEIWSQVKGQHPQAASSLETFLRENSHANQDVDDILEEFSQNMSETDISDLIDTVEKSVEVAKEAAEAAEQAAEAAEEATSVESDPGEGEAGGTEGQEDPAPEGGDDGGQDIPGPVKERLQEYEGLLQEEGLLDEEDLTDWDDLDGEESGDEGEVPDHLEKRLSTIEKALEGQSERQGSASILDGEGGMERVSKASPGAQTKDVVGHIQED